MKRREKTHYQRGGAKGSQVRASCQENRRHQCIERARALRHTELQSRRSARNSTMSILRSIFIPEESESKSTSRTLVHSYEGIEGLREGSSMIVDEDSGLSEMRRSDLNDEEHPEDELVALCGGWEQYQDLVLQIELELLAETPLDDDRDELAAGELYYGLFDELGPDDNEFNNDDDQGTIQCPFCEGLMRGNDKMGGTQMVCNLCTKILPLSHPQTYQPITVAQLKDLLARSLERYVLFPSLPSIDHRISRYYTSNNPHIFFLHF
jgi:hypothetical protein